MKSFKIILACVLVVIAVMSLTGRVGVRYDHADESRKALFVLLPGYDEVARNVGREDPMFRARMTEGGRLEFEDISQDCWVTVEVPTDRHPYRISPWF